MKNQALFSWIDKSKKLRCLLQFLFGTLRVKTSRTLATPGWGKWGLTGRKWGPLFSFWKAWADRQMSDQIPVKSPCP